MSPQVLEVEQQQALVIGDLEHQLQHAGLRVVEVEQAGQEQRAHVGNRRPNRDAVLAEDVPEGDRKRPGQRQPPSQARCAMRCQISACRPG